MQIRLDALAGALAKRLPPCVWIHGDEPLQQLEAADLVRERARAAGFAERQVFQVDRSFKPEALLAETASLSLFGGDKLIELRFANKPGKDSAGYLGEVLAGLPDSLRLLVTSPRLDRAAVDTAWFAAIDAHACVVPVYPIERGQLTQWIARRLDRQEQRADDATLQMIAERVEGNLLAAHQEIRKLGLLFPAGRLPADEVRAAVLNVARYDAFDLAEAMLVGDAARSLRSLDGLRAEGEAEPLILWAVAEATRTLLRIAQAVQAGKAVPQAIRDARIFAPRDRPYEHAMRALRDAGRGRGTGADGLSAGIARLTRAMQWAAKTDRIIKGIESGDAWQALETLVLTVAGAPLLTPLED